MAERARSLSTSVVSRSGLLMCSMSARYWHNVDWSSDTSPTVAASSLDVTLEQEDTVSAATSAPAATTERRITPGTLAAAPAGHPSAAGQGRGAGCERSGSVSGTMIGSSIVIGGG